MSNSQSIKATKASKTSKANISSVSIFLLILMLLTSACSNQPKPSGDNRASGDLKNISKSIVDMVADPQPKEPPLVNKMASIKVPVTIKNLYLEQQKTAMSGIPLFTIDQYQKALKAIDKKQWQQATSLLDEIISTQPQLSGAYYHKAVIARAQNKNSIALVEVNNAIKANKLNLYAHHLKGQLLRLKGDFSGAEQSYLTALAIWPNYADVHVNMAILLELYRGRLLDAHQYYGAYLALKPEDQQVKRYLAGLEIKIKRAGLVLPKDFIKTNTNTNTNTNTKVEMKAATTVLEKG